MATQPTIEALLEHESWVRQLALTLVREDSSARDVAQEVWVRALEHPPRLGEGASPRPWLATVVRNLIAQRSRDSARRETRERDASQPEALPSVDRALARESARRAVVESVFALPEPYREVLLLRYFDELSPSAIAARLSVPGSTVRSRLQRAHEMLRTRLAPTDPDDRALAVFLAPLLRDRTASLPLAAGAVVLSTKLFVAGALAIAAALLVWLTLHSESGQPSTSAIAAPSAAPTVGAPPAARSDSAVEDAIDGRRESSVTPNAPRDAKASLRVRVLERSTGAAISGAHVSYASEAVVPFSRSDDLERDLVRHGRTLDTDEHGEAPLEFAGAPLNICARHGDLWGQTQATSPRENVVTLELIPDRELQVQVVDRDGVPVAGVPIALIARGERGTNGRWTGITLAPQGLARIAHIDFRLHPASDTNSTPLVEFAFPQNVEYGIPVDLAHLPTEPLRMQLPPHGSLHVSVLAPDDTPLSVPTRVQVMSPNRFADGTSPLVTQLSLEHGHAELTYVGLGLDLNISAFPDDAAAVERGMASVRGPQRDGEAVSAVVRVGSPKPSVRGRAIDTGGQPLASRVITGWLHERTELDAGPREDAQTDADGKFELRFGAGHLHAPSLDLELSVPADALHEAATGRVSAVVVGQGIDLGDVVLQPPPILVSGRVVDASGSGVARASVVVVFRPQISAEDPKKLAELRALGYATQDEEWLPTRQPELQTDENGNFVWRGEIAAMSLAVMGVAPGFLVSTIPFERGARDVVVPIEREAALAGSVKLLDSFAGQALWVRARKSQTELRASRVDGEGKFEIRQLERGVVSVVVTIEPGGRELAVVDGVEVRPGEVTRDPRLDSFDLSQRVHVFELSVRSRAGDPVLGGRIHYSIPDAAPSQPTSVLIRGGRALIASAEPALDLHVEAPGFRTRNLRTDSDRMVIELEPMFEVLLRRDRSLRVAVEQMHIEARLTPPNGLKDAAPITRRFADEDEQRVEACCAGEWRLEWVLQDEKLAQGRLLQSATLDVRDGGPILIDALRIDGKEMHRFVSELFALRTR